MKFVVIHQQGGIVGLSDYEIDVIRKQFREQAKETVPVVVLRPGLAAQVLEVDALPSGEVPVLAQAMEAKSVVPSVNGTHGKRKGA